MLEKNIIKPCCWSQVTTYIKINAFILIDTCCDVLKIYKRNEMLWK